MGVRVREVRGSKYDIVFFAQGVYTIHMYVLIPLGLVTLTGIIYLAISRKSSPVVRIAALVALALMIIAVIVCLLILFGVIETAASKAPVLPDAPVDSVPVKPTNFVALIMLVVFLVIMFVLVLILSMRERHQIANNKVDW